MTAEERSAHVERIATRAAQLLERECMALRSVTCHLKDGLVSSLWASKVTTGLCATPEASTVEAARARAFELAVRLRNALVDAERDHPTGEITLHLDTGELSERFLIDAR